MSDHIYKVVELVGSSQQSLEEAIGNALERAAHSIRHMDWFEVTEIRGVIADGNKVGHYQVGVKVGFRVEEE